MLEHGGRLLRAARQFGIAPEQWLDLSTGVSPWPWPVPALPASAWQRLPEDEDGLREAAQSYYGAAQLLPVAGSQAAIQALPQLRARSRVGIIAPGYNEHAHAWRRAGHDVVLAAADVLRAAVDDFDVLVLIHPNNPGGDRFAGEHLLDLRARLARRGGWLVVDEAFIDATPENSLCAHAGIDGLVVLRSIGKFFGMAGARAGFVFAVHDLLDTLRERLGPWALSGPSRWAVRQALVDRAWQAQARPRLLAASNQLGALLGAQGLPPQGGSAFFQWCVHADAPALNAALAQRAILTRLFDTPASLRFGLPPDPAGFRRLEIALREILQ
ncbi:MAG TPA: threonine-phosphate decarboxylase CobD [Stenotrophomonas sp.]|nr:threonine-phosphate decarboxylase CobD [Stenotrophomonas sp.]